MKKALRQLKEDMKYKDGTEILLALSIASDEMTRHVHMFPEVFYLDVTANTNKQKRDLFVMVMKDASGETFVGNLTIIPSGQLWVFMRIYETFFVKLYGEHTISRNRLVLTDDDKSEHGPLDSLIASSPIYKKSKHMLCIFHAIVQTFQKEIYPKLPSQRRDGKQIDKEGKNVL